MTTSSSVDIRPSGLAFCAPTTSSIIKPATLSLFDDFFKAAIENDAVTLLNLLKQGLDLNKLVDEDGNYAIHVAAREGSAEVVDLFLRYGSQVDLANERGQTALHFAALKGWDSVVKLLVESNANVEERTKMGCTALYFASAMGHTSAVRYLLSVGANPNVITKLQSTPLLAAAFKGNDEVVSLLVMKGAEINFQNPRGQTPMHAAAERSFEDIHRFLLQNGGNPNLLDVQGRTSEVLRAPRTTSNAVPLAPKSIQKNGSNNVKSQTMGTSTCAQSASHRQHGKCSVQAAADVSGSSSRREVGLEASPTSSTASS